MDNGNKKKWQLSLVTILIVVLGFAAGALAMNGYNRWRHQSPRQDRFAALLDSLQLNDDQKKQAHEVLNDTRSQLVALRRESEPRVIEIRKQADDRLQKIMTPEHWPRFQQERDKLRRDRRG